MKFLVTSVILFFIFLFAIDMFIDGMIYSDVRHERIENLIISILVISGEIIYLRMYIKDKLKDISKEQIRVEDKKTKNIGEIIQVVLFGVVIFMPIWNLPRFITMYNTLIEKKELFLEVGKSLSYSVLGIFLLMSLNPLNIKEKINFSDSKNS